MNEYINDTLQHGLQRHSGLEAAKIFSVKLDKTISYCYVCAIVASLYRSK